MNIKGDTGETGSAGVDGAQGTAGADGQDGQTGQDGAAWLTGAGIPEDSFGKDSDLYLNIDNGDVYKKSSGHWNLIGNIQGEDGAQGIQGISGQDGQDGATWLTGVVSPTNDLGSDGDIYLNSVNGDIFKKTDSSWNLIGNIKGAKGDTGETGAQGPGGADGQDGATWLTGAGVPNDSFGADTDLYLNLDNGDIYKKTSGHWNLVGNIKGETGLQGETGTAGNDGADGASWLTGVGIPGNEIGENNDLYLNSSTGDVYKKSSGTWNVIGNIKGNAGADGQDGATWITGTGIPNNEMGSIDDLYLNTDNGDIYKKSASQWDLIGNIKGEQGVTGDTGSAGQDGATWFSGAGVPGITVSENDLYLDTISGDVYKYTSSLWSKIGNIKGVIGDQGDKGEPGPMIIPTINITATPLADDDVQMTILLSHTNNLYGIKIFYSDIEYGNSVLVDTLIYSEGALNISELSKEYDRGYLRAAAVDNNNNVGLLSNHIYIDPIHEVGPYSGYIMTDKFGSFGSLDEQFDTPTDVAVDANGYIYIADKNHYAIKKFNSEGKYISQWGSDGYGSGQFKTPTDIAVDGDGYIYVCDNTTDVVQKFDANGVFRTSWSGGTHPSSNAFVNPVSLAVDSTNNIYVLDSTYYNYDGFNWFEIQKFNRFGEFVSKFAVKRYAGENSLYTPVDLAIDSNDNIYILDSSYDKVMKFTSDGIFISQWGSYGTSGHGKFSTPTNIGIDSGDHVYVVDSGRDDVQIFDANGGQVGVQTGWGQTGYGDGQFVLPTGLDIDNLGNVYIADQTRHDVQKFGTYKLRTVKVGVGE